MRRFEVWLDKGIPGEDPDVEVIELPNNATSAQVDEACRDCLDTMIGNLLDTGWRELPKTERRT